MPLADPIAAADYNRERWRSHGAIYRAQRTPPLPPISRQQALNEDVAQARELERLEAKRIGRRLAARRFVSWLAAEKAWLAVGSTFLIGGLDADRP